MYGSRLLTLLSGSRTYVDTFDVSPARLVPVVGSLAVSGGALKAASAGDWLGQLVGNPEMTTNTTGWTATNMTASRVDSEADPGANSGGTDKWALKAVATGTAGNTRTQYAIATAFIVGAAYTGRARLYAPSANSTANAASLRVLGAAFGGSEVRVTAEDVWQALAVTDISGGTTGSVGVWPGIVSAGAVIGDTLYADAVTCYRQNTVALLAGWRSPNVLITIEHISPASGVAPYAIPFRYTDAMNYWEARLLPNTVDNDLQIVQVTAGVETVRAAADVDWTSGGVDGLRILAEGSVIGLEHKKSGAGSWTDSASWSAATQGQGAPALGAMLWDTNVPRLASMQVETR